MIEKGPTVPLELGFEKRIGQYLNEIVLSARITIEKHVTLIEKIDIKTRFTRSRNGVAIGLIQKIAGYVNYFVPRLLREKRR